jgi:hypothetical protein
LWYDRGETDAGQFFCGVVNIVQQSLKLESILIGHARMVGGETPVRDKVVAVVQAKGQIGIAKVDCQEHDHGLR